MAFTFNPLFKTEMCKSLIEKGSCPEGGICNYAHSHQDLRRHPRYKTHLCHVFMDKGFCPNEGHCQFAHSDQELRVDPNYKTKMCGMLKHHGRCRDRFCQYAHSPEEIRVSTRLGVDRVKPWNLVRINLGLGLRGPDNRSGLDNRHVITEGHRSLRKW